MRSAIIMRRPGILTVSGYVQEVFDNEIVINNDLNGHPLNIHLTKTAKCTWLRGLTAGAAIVATTDDNFAIEMILDGGDVPLNEITLGCYNMRFNGSFDFNKRNDIKEQHVFAGTLLSATKKEQAGIPYEIGVVSWKKKGQSETRVVYRWNPSGLLLTNLIGKRIITVTGEAVVTKKGKLFQCDRIYEF